MQLGIDLGGSKIEAVVIKGDVVLARKRIATPQRNYQKTLLAIGDLIAQLEQEVAGDKLPIGLGHPGSIDPASGLLRNANSTCLNGQALKQDLEQRLGRSVAMNNDANCLALSESYDGAAKGADSAFCVILGTGVGGALLLNGTLIEGANGLGGEWGHNPVPWSGERDTLVRDCWCGHKDCLETWLSGPGLFQTYTDQGGRDAETASDVAAKAALGNELAVLTLLCYIRQLGRALAGVINLFDPERIVLAGGLSHIQSLYDSLPEAWAPWVFADKVHTRVIPAKHGDSSGVMGAARLSQ